MSRSKTDEGRQKRLDLIAFLRSYVKEHGYAPSMGSMQEHLGLSRTAVEWHLKSLRDQRFITYEDGALTRTLRNTRKAPERVE